MRAILIALILLVSPGSAQAPAVRGPVLGYAFDSGSIRPVLGIPGAALLGQAFDLGGSLDRAAVSPRQDLALAVASSDSRVLIVSLPSGAAEPCECAPGPDRMVFSPGGDAAALYYAAGSTVRVLRGGSPAGDFDLSLFPGKLTALAVSDAGALLAAVSPEEGSAAVYFLEPGSDPRLVLSLRRASVLAFIPGSADALAADDIDNRVYLVHDPAGSAAATVVAAAENGINGPVAIRALGTSRVLTVNSQSGAITVTDLAGGASSTIECGCTPTELEPLAGSIYRLTASGPIWLLDAGAPELRTAFVPPDAPAQVPAQEGQL
jgi:hypothetical protein